MHPLILRPVRVSSIVEKNKNYNALIGLGFSFERQDLLENSIEKVPVQAVDEATEFKEIVQNFVAEAEKIVFTANNKETIDILFTNVAQNFLDTLYKKLETNKYIRATFTGFEFGIPSIQNSGILAIRCTGGNKQRISRANLKTHFSRLLYLKNDAQTQAVIEDFVNFREMFNEKLQIQA